MNSYLNREMRHIVSWLASDSSNIIKVNVIYMSITLENCHEYFGMVMNITVLNRIAVQL
jgi:hypothetical protein